MICNSCKTAADTGRVELHDQCANVDRVRPYDGAQDTTWCDCHHRIGTLGNIQPEVVPNMPNPIIPPHFSHPEGS